MWKRSWELAIWEQQERESVVITQIRGFEGALAESQVVAAARQRQLRIEVEQMLPHNWRMIHQELLNLESRYISKPKITKS